MNYKGKSSFQTLLGAFISIATFAIIMVNFVAISQDFMDGSRQEEKIQSVSVDSFFTDAYKLSE